MTTHDPAVDASAIIGLIEEAVAPLKEEIALLRQQLDYQRTHLHNDRYSRLWHEHRHEHDRLSGLTR
jgi:hypothetical protein